MADAFDARTKNALVELGDHIRVTRERLGISQSTLARRIGMEATNLAKVERGEKNVTVETLLRISEGLGVELVVMFVERPRT